jgi:hypothetical protein
MASDTQIVNLALVRIGVDKVIANLDTENSKEAAAARVLYSSERDYVLRDFHWPFATAYSGELGLVSDPDEAFNSDWLYAYRYPSGCLDVRRILTPSGRQETAPPPFTVARDGVGRLILTDYEDAEVEYTAAVTDAQEFDPLFVSMLAWRIGGSLALSLSRVKGISDTCVRQYQMEKLSAQARALGETQPHETPDAAWVRDR